MENKEYLNEEKFQDSKKKLKTLGIVLLAVGGILFIVGIILVIVGFLSFGNSAANIMDSSTKGNIMGGFGMFTIGGFMSAFGFTIAGAGGIILFIAHRREITAFTVQQTMPVAQEGIEKMTPTVADTAGEIAKSISKGIADGKKESEESNKNE